MPRYPVLLDIAGRTAVVVGGGRVAERKVHGLLEAGACVRVVSPAVTAGLSALVDAGRIEWRARPYAPGDLAGACLTFAATDRRDVNQAVLSDAGALRVPCNVADDPAACDFLVPSVVRRGDLVLAVSTGGASPAAARRVRERLEAEFGPEWAAYLDLLAAIRRAVLGLGEPAARNRALFEAIDGLDLLPLVREGRWPEIERAVVAAAASHGGANAADRFTLDALGVARGAGDPGSVRR